MNKSLGRLMAGFRKFRERYFLENEFDTNNVYQKLASQGQTPKTLLIGCSDSRVDPAIMTGATPGELFVIRNVANLIPPCETARGGLHGTSSALEFAVVNLKVENVIILGHRQCGGIRALMSDSPVDPNGFIGKWMSIAKSAKDKVLAENPTADEETRLRLGEMEALKISVRNLRTFPFVQEAVQARNMNIIGVYFDLEQGQLWQFDEAEDQFKQLII
jgi:carbonic anhydrase